MSEDKKKDFLKKDSIKETKNTLEQRNLRSDAGDDEQLKDRMHPVDFEGKDLDVPGRTLTDQRTKKQLKDEENQLYSENDSE